MNEAGAEPLATPFDMTPPTVTIERNTLSRAFFRLYIEARAAGETAQTLRCRTLAEIALPIGLALQAAADPGDVELGGFWQARIAQVTHLTTLGLKS